MKMQQFRSELDFRRKEEEIRLKQEMQHLSASCGLKFTEPSESDTHLHTSDSHGADSIVLKSSMKTVSSYDIVKELSKPKIEIAKFSGDPLKYQKFLRQYNQCIASNTDNFDERLNYLEQLTVDEPLKIVSGYSSLPSDVAVKAIFREFNERYGQSSVIANAYIKKALDWPNVKADCPKTLDELAIFLLECHYAVENVNSLGILDYSDNIRRLVTKLPFHLQEKWRSRVFDIKERGNIVKFYDFVDFVKKESKKSNDPDFGRTYISETASRYSAKTPSSNAATFKSSKKSPSPKSFATATSEATALDKCSLCSDNHELSACRVFKAKSLPERVAYVRQENLCFGCFQSGHRSRWCPKRLKCSICSYKHPTLLHD